MIAETLQASPALFALTAGILGLLVGSFLNVVIYRLPLMMEHEWRSQVQEYMAEQSGAEIDPQPAFNLLTPRSRCPQCGHAIRALENIPVISYLFLRGRCSECGTHIPWRYPVVEIITAVLSAIVAWHFGFGWQAAAALVFTWALIPLCGIDIDHQLLPDAITLPLLWAGLTLSLSAVFVDAHASIIGALAGYLSLWIVYMVFKLVTGKEGMGYGDFKLLAALGAWMGWTALPTIIVLSSIVGATTGVLLIVIRGRDRNVPIPFGPYLAAAGWIALLWGEELTRWYLDWARLGV